LGSKFIALSECSHCALNLQCQASSIITPFSCFSFSQQGLNSKWAVNVHHCFPSMPRDSLSVDN
jgi:hypothetical protein